MNATIRGLLCVGLLVQLLVRCRHRVGHSPGIGWEGVLERLKVLADLCADRAVIEALPKTDLSGMFQRMLNRWPAKEDFDAEPPQAVLALLTLTEAILGETRDEVVRPGVSEAVTTVCSCSRCQSEPRTLEPKDTRTTTQRLDDSIERLRDRVAAANPERQLEPETARAAARNRRPLDGADAQALEGALSMTERERDEARAALAKANEDGKRWCEEFHTKLNERDEARFEAERLREALLAAQDEIRGIQGLRVGHAPHRVYADGLFGCERIDALANKIDAALAVPQEATHVS